MKIEINYIEKDKEMAGPYANNGSMVCYSSSDQDENFVQNFADQLWMYEGVQGLYTVSCNPEKDKVIFVVSAANQVLVKAQLEKAAIIFEDTYKSKGLECIITRV